MPLILKGMPLCEIKVGVLQASNLHNVSFGGKSFPINATKLSGEMMEKLNFYF